MNASFPRHSGLLAFEDQAPESPFALPEDLTVVEDLAGLEAEALAAFEALRLGDNSAATIAEMTRLADAVDALRAEAARRIEEAETNAAAVAALEARLAPAEAEAETDAEAEVEAPAAEAVEAEVVETPELVTAAAKPVVPAVRKAPAVPARLRPVAPKRAGWDMTLVAAADIPGFSGGTTIENREALARAVQSKSRTLADRSGYVPIASIEKHFDAAHRLDGVDDSVVAERLLAGRAPQALVASGGWCAPSETVYDFFCQLEGVDGLIDLPTFQSSRGGLRYPISPKLSDVQADADSGFTWTEANDIAAAEAGGPTKPCFVIPCPTFTEVRVEAQGICLTAGNLMERAWPENVARYLDLVMVAHQHRLNSRKIAKMVAAIPAANQVTVPATFGTLSHLLATIELQVQHFRDVNFMVEDALLEAVFPRWVRGAIRSDLARREGVRPEAVSNADIAAWFRLFGVSAQFVMDWQALTGPALPTAWPTTVQFMLYPAGNFFVLDGGTLDLGVVRDSTLNQTNDFTAAWMEEFFQVADAGCGALLVTTEVCPDGKIGERADLVCEAPPTPPTP